MAYKFIFDNICIPIWELHGQVSASQFVKLLDKIPKEYELTGDTNSMEAWIEALTRLNQISVACPSGSVRADGSPYRPDVSNLPESWSLEANEAGTSLVYPMISWDTYYSNIFPHEPTTSTSTGRYERWDMRGRLAPKTHVNGIEVIIEWYHSDSNQAELLKFIFIRKMYTMNNPGGD